MASALFSNLSNKVRQWFSFREPEAGASEERSGFHGIKNISSKNQATQEQHNFYNVGIRSDRPTFIQRSFVDNDIPATSFVENNEDDASCNIRPSVPRRQENNRFFQTSLENSYNVGFERNVQDDFDPYLSHNLCTPYAKLSQGSSASVCFQSGRSRDTKRVMGYRKRPILFWSKQGKLFCTQYAYDKYSK